MALVLTAAFAIIAHGHVRARASCNLPLASAFSTRPSRVPAASAPRADAKGSGGEEEASFGSKAVWSMTEWAGRISALSRPKGDPDPPQGPKPASLDEAFARLDADYDRAYFITGSMDAALYDEGCEFADPFTSFRGRRRFEENLANLATGFITDSRLRTLDRKADRGDPAEGRPPSYQTRLLVRLQLALPWKPVLAWPWGVTHYFDPETLLIVRHVESWDVSAAEGVRQLLRPGPPGGLDQGRTKAAASTEPSTRPELDPITGPVVRLLRGLGALPAEEEGGWEGEPLAWAEEASWAQRLSAATQQWARPIKQLAADVAAGEYDAAEVDARIDKLVAASGCVVFAFEACPFCKRALELLESEGCAPDVHYVDREPWGAAARAQLGRRTGRTSLPSVWIGGECVGGLSDGTPGLRQLQASGELVPRLRAAGAGPEGSDV